MFQEENNLLVNPHDESKSNRILQNQKSAKNCKAISVSFKIDFV
jgi:hypothetical protein